MRVTWRRQNGSDQLVLGGFERRTILVGHGQQIALNDVVTETSRAWIAGFRVTWSNGDNDALDLRLWLGRPLFLWTPICVGLEYDLLFGLGADSGCQGEIS